MPYIPIANHERYLINSHGDVLSTHRNNILKPRINLNGYLIVTLDLEQLSVHRLVALHFIPNPYGYPQVNHKNGDKQDNRALNLEWTTPTQNIEHALKTGLRTGFVAYDVKLELMHRAIAGELIADLALEIPGIHPNTLSKMLRTTAKAENLQNEWKDAMKIRRRNVAIANLEKINN